MYVRAHIRKTSCCHDAKEKAMQRWFLFFIFAKEVVFTLAVGWWGFDQPSSTRTLHALADMGPATALATFARAPGAACSRIMTAGNRDRSPFAVHGCSNLHRFVLDFFDSNFFALRFAVVSQCPEIDSQIAMRNRINYSLILQPSILSVQQEKSDFPWVCNAICQSLFADM